MDESISGFKQRGDWGDVVEHVGAPLRERTGVLSLTPLIAQKVDGRHREVVENVPDERGLPDSASAVEDEELAFLTPQV